MIYFIVLVAALILALGYLFYKIRIHKLELGFVFSQNTELTGKCDSLLQDKITNIQKIENLQGKIDYLNQLLNETEKARHQAFDATKAVLYDLGNDLSKQLIEIHKKENIENRELSEKNIATTAEKFHHEFERLVNMIASLNRDVEQSKDTVDLLKQSLLSPSGAGRLAEITLENILKASGLRANLDFVMQYTISGIDNSKLRPDAIIFLPAGNLMVIDAKASKFLVDDQNPENLARTMNMHLKSLSSKEYAENIINNFIDQQKNLNNTITLMFLPTEQAVEKILNADHNFMTKAWSACIFPVGPSGVMNMLSFAKFQISDQMRSENHQLIIEEVKKLLSSIATLADFSQKLGSNIQSVVNNYDKFAGSFNRHLLSRAKTIQKLGIDAGNKNIPSTLERYQIVSSKSELIEASPVISTDSTEDI